MKGILRKKRAGALLLYAAVALLAAGCAAAEDAAEFVVDGYAFSIRTTPVEAFPLPLERMRLSPGKIEVQASFDQLREVFGADPASLRYEPGEQSPHFFKTATERLDPPYEDCPLTESELSSAAKEEKIAAATEKSRAFLAAMGIPETSVAYACYAMDSGCGRQWGEKTLVCIPNEQAAELTSAERYIVLRFLYQVHGLPLPDRFVGGGEGSLSGYMLDSTYADFVFSDDGLLCYCTYRKLNIKSSEFIAGQPLTWDEATALAGAHAIRMRDQYPLPEYQDFQAFFADYEPVITKAAPTWLTNYDNSIQPGWQVDIRFLSRTDGTDYNPNHNATTLPISVFLDALTGEIRQ